MDRILKYYNRIIDNLSNQELIKTSELNGLSIYSKEISELVESGYIERVKQGYYRIVEHTEDHSEAKLIILKENSSLYSLINDHSHGAIRKNNGYTEETLEKACQTVISFINSKVPGQIEEVKAILQERNTADGGK